MENSRTLIIAEAGVNHNGDKKLAMQLVDAAVDAGADIIKFQTFKTEGLVTSTAQMAQYQIQNSQNEDSQFAMLKKLELPAHDFVEIQKYCMEKNIRFLSTGFDLESLAFLKSLKMGLWKIPSGEITNLPYLEFIGKCNEPTLVSTGMANLNEIKDALRVLSNSGTDNSKITVLHCNTEYPTPYADVHLRAMLTIKNVFGVSIGYSDHTLGTEVSVAAVALGAKVIEKHFTLDKTLIGPDHKASLEPHELKLLVAQVRHIEQALGDTKKKPSPSEIKNISVARKSIVAGRTIHAGEIFSPHNLTTKRPGSGLSPMKWYDVIGRKAPRNFEKDELIEI